jgi:hypothetical protein
MPSGTGHDTNLRMRNGLRWNEKALDPEAQTSFPGGAGLRGSMLSPASLFLFQPRRGSKDLSTMASPAAFIIRP